MRISICGADAGDGGSRGRQERERASGRERTGGELLSLSLSLSLSRERARRGAARGARERRGGARACHRPPEARRHRHTPHTRDRESGASEHSLSLSHRDYKVFKRNYNLKKKYAASEPREQQGRVSTPHAHTRHLDLPTPARARHTAPARAPADGLWGHNRSARRPPRYAAPHQLTTPARWPVQGYQFLYINYTPSAMSHVDVRQHIDIIVRKTHTY
jgi:hypothetical protein